MENSKPFLRRIFIIVFLFMSLLMFLLNLSIYWALQRLIVVLSSGSDATLQLALLDIKIPLGSLYQIIDFLKLIESIYLPWVLPVTAVFFIFFTMLMWLVLRLSVSNLFNGKASVLSSEQDFVKPKKDAADQRMEQERKRRMFLHFLSVLQREGRLLDFFGEDLSLYEDEQIGAAVRSIHEDCRVAVDKYIAPVPVIDQEEGELIDIEAGFDPNSVKLTGNVAGDPPFKGILRHRGWKAGKKEVPRLADVLDSGIIVPAEVEIE
ncbi:hypothetical protein JCM12294_01840 [Desulfocicer niacini]